MNDYKKTIISISPLIRYLCQEYFLQVHQLKIEQKNDGSFVTNCDIEIDTKIKELLKDAFPRASFISEESQSNTEHQEGFVWCIDPIDGTHNFMMDIPYYAVSIALLFNGNPIAGIIYDPSSNDILYGGEEIEVTLNDKPLEYENSSMIVVTNRSHSKKNKERECDIVNQILSFSDSLKFRRFGSCALDIMNFVRGRIGAVYIIGNDLWDWSAGMAIVKGLQNNISIEKKEDFFYIVSHSLKDKISVIK